MPAVLLPFWAALSFLTRLLPPPKTIDERLLAAAVPWHPVAGLSIGCIATVPLYFGAGSVHFLGQGLLYTVITVWITRALHWDGLADVADAWGSGQHGERFHTILKDSRIGAFGVMALVLGLFTYILAAGLACQKAYWSVLILAPALGRMATILLAGSCSAHHPDSFLGRVVYQAVTPRLFWVILLICMATSWVIFSFSTYLFVLACMLCCLFTLRRLAEREGGVNGDFFGCAIVLTEIVLLVACL